MTSALKSFDARDRAAWSPVGKLRMISAMISFGSQVRIDFAARRVSTISWRVDLGVRYGSESYISVIDTYLSTVSRINVT